MSTGSDRRKAKKAQRQQEAALQKQLQQEQARLAEAESEEARRKQVNQARGSGRSLLVQTSQTGTKTNLGA